MKYNILRFQPQRKSIKFYTSFIAPVLPYGAATWTMTTSEGRLLLGLSERNVLRTIYGPLRIGIPRFRYIFENIETAGTPSAQDGCSTLERLGVERLDCIGYFQLAKTTKIIMNGALLFTLP